MGARSDDNVLLQPFDYEKKNEAENADERYLKHITNPAKDTHALSINDLLMYPRKATNYITETQNVTAMDTHVPSESENSSESSDSSLTTEDITAEPCFFAAEVDAELCAKEPTEQDIDMTICENLRKKLRNRVTLPEDDCGRELKSQDLETGVRLPWYRRDLVVLHKLRSLHESYFPSPTLYSARCDPI